MPARSLTAADIQGVTPDQFEQLTFLLARAEGPEVVIVRNKDRGLDARLPDPMGRLTLRGWQAKRFATGEVQWSQCEDSIRTALAFWRPLWITFVFAHDLSAGEQETFRKRLIEAFPIVRLNFWSAEEVLRRLRDTEEGRRATVWLFGRGGTLEELIASMVDKEAVEGARAIAERQAALNQQFNNDPHLYYTAVVRPDGAPETTSAPQTIASVILSMEGQEVRYDLSERYPGAITDLGGGPRLVLRNDDEGARAREILRAAADAAGPIEINSGTGIVWPEVPVGLRGLVPEEPIWGPVTLSPQDVEQTATEPGMLALLIADKTQLGVRFTQTDEALTGWDGTMIGATGGLELTQSIRVSGRKLAAVHTDWRHTLGVGTATEQYLSAQLLLSALDGHEIVMQLGDHSTGIGRGILSLEDHDFDEEAITDLRTHVSFLAYVCEVQAWLGLPLFPPARPTADDVAELSRALGFIRQPHATGTWTEITLATDTGDPDSVRGEIAILQPVRVLFFGGEYYLGMEMLQIQSAVIDREGEKIVLRPGDSNTLTTELLHPDEAPPSAARLEGTGLAGRVLFRPADATDARRRESDG
jgi:hypothetical protein